MVGLPQSNGMKLDFQVLKLLEWLVYNLQAIKAHDFN